MGHIIDWGYDIFKYMEPPHNENNELMNMGYRTTFDLEDMKCPCGTKIKNSRYSTMCAACGSWTCSAQCHDTYIQREGKCVFIRNFIKNSDTAHIQGLRHILGMNVFAMHKDGLKEHTP